MRADRPSTTAAIVAAARAEIHRRPTLRDFSDPYAERLLPRSYSEGPAAWVIRRVTRSGAHLFALRTNAIDDGIREAHALQQVVILGAGLDARAWRLPELADVPVYEVDHPSTQRYKKKKSAQFATRADHSFVAVDFERDSLDEKLAASGHDTQRPTVWVWEGVTMYLAPEAVEATLSTVSERSAVDSRLLMTYLPPSATRTALKIGVQLLGEPFRASYRPAEIVELYERYGFHVAADTSAVEWHERWATDRTLLAPVFSNTERLVAADRVADG